MSSVGFSASLQAFVFDYAHPFDASGILDETGAANVAGTCIDYPGGVRPVVDGYAI